jgi:hypothetical protein
MAVNRAACWARGEQLRARGPTPGRSGARGAGSLTRDRESARPDELRLLTFRVRMSRTFFLLSRPDVTSACHAER